MTPETDIRQKKLLDLLRGSIQPAKTDTPDPTQNQPQMRPRIQMGGNGISGLPKPGAPQPDPVPTANPEALSSLSQVQPVKIGESTQGMDATQKQQTYLDLLKQASPRSSVTQTPGFIEEGAPKPKGHGLLNTLKHLGEGALISTGEYARTHPGASAGELIGAGGAGAVVGGVTPDTIDYVRRQAQIGQAQGDLDQQLNTQKEIGQINQLGQVPVTLANGTTVYTDRKHAADLISKQQDVELKSRQEGNRESAAQAHRARWDAMDRHQAAQEAQAVYNSGAADNDPEMLAEVGKRMGLTKAPPPHTAGEIRLNEKGGYILINKRGGQVSDTGQESYEPTREANKETRANIIASGTNTRANQKRQQEAAALAGQAKAAQLQIQDLQSKIQSDPSHKAYYEGEIGKQQAALAKAQTALGPYADVYDEKGPRQLSGNTPASRGKKYSSIDAVIQDFKNSPKNTTHRDPTANELLVLKQRYGVQ